MTGTAAAKRILAAAAELYARHGYDTVSMSAIARRAKVSKANVFHHFRSKRELYLVVVRNACHDAADRLRYFERSDSVFLKRLTRYTESQLADMLAHGSASRLILRGLLHDDDVRRVQMLAERVFGEAFARLVQILRAGQERGDLRANADPVAAAILLIGANVFFFEARELLRHLPEVDFATDPPRYSRRVINILLRGIAGTTTRG